MNSSSQSRIFVSYSHRGKGPEWMAKLLRALYFFEQWHLLDVWQDGKIRVSSFWDDNIKQAMNSARIAVVLLTREALEVRPTPDANYILDTEFPFLRELQRQGRLTVFPVVCEDCDWRIPSSKAAVDADSIPSLIFATCSHAWPTWSDPVDRCGAHLNIG